LESAAHHDWEASKAQGQITPKDLGLIPDIEIDENSEGYQIFQSQQTCVGCHGGDLTGVGTNPMLLGNELTADEVLEIIKNGRGAMPGGQFSGTDEEAQILAEFIASLKEE